MRLINNRSIVQLRVSTNEVIEAGLSLFQHIYGDKTKALETLRFLSYSRMIAKKKLNPSRLPPATSSATEHILRSYLQYHNWVTLDTASLNQLGNYVQCLGKNLRQADFYRNVLSIVSGTTPKSFQSGSVEQKKLQPIFSRRVNQPEDRT